ncbi:MAG: YbaK/EbsC family protein [Thermoleophilaceae bacterium]|nr:YbaK/EbsC family protein [Thermoleophilaceae bacterium]
MRQTVIEAARRLGLKVNVATLATPTRTAAQAAAAVGCEEARIAKSIVFVADGDPVVCVVSGAHRIDPARICEALDCTEVRQASPAEVRAATGFAIGGVSPLGHQVPVVIDEALLRHERVWAACGDGNSVFEVDIRELAERSGAAVVPLAAEDAPQATG